MKKGLLFNWINVQRNDFAVVEGKESSFSILANLADALFTNLDFATMVAEITLDCFILEALPQQRFLHHYPPLRRGLRRR